MSQTVKELMDRLKTSIDEGYGDYIVENYDFEIGDFLIVCDPDPDKNHIKYIRTWGEQKGEFK